MGASRRLRDDCGRLLELPGSVNRVVCLCPSISETIVHLAPGRLAGRTRYCIHPSAGMHTVPTVGGTKNPDIEAITALQPDLIIAEKEENRPEDVAALAERFPVYVFDVQHIAGALAMLHSLGALLGEPAAALSLEGDIRHALNAMGTAPRAVSALYLIWRKPWMAAGAGTYIHSVLEALGFTNVMAEKHRYPELGVSALEELSPQVVLLSSEPYPFTHKHIAEVQQLFPSAKVLCVDGELFSWYGVRMKAAFETLPWWLAEQGVGAH